jgi:UDP-glucose 4-epimerase
MTHVENCADVFALAAAERAPGPDLERVVDGPGERIWTYLTDYMRGSASRVGACPSPTCSPFGVVRLAFATGLQARHQGAQHPHSTSIRVAAQAAPFENRRLRETLGWTPPLDYQQCLARTYGPAAPRGAGR